MLDNGFIGIKKKYLLSMTWVDPSAMQARVKSKFYGHQHQSGTFLG